LVLDLDMPLVRTAVWLQLIAGGHLMLFLTLTKHFFWRWPYPVWALLGAIIGTQVLAVILAGFGLLVPAIPWKVVGIIRAYNVVWMFVQDLIKVAAYRLIANKAKHQSKYLEAVNRPLHPHLAR
jgi:H+-transporting ATPase